MATRVEVVWDGFGRGMRKLDLRFRVSDGLQGVAVNSVSVIISVLASKMEYFGYFSNSAKLFGATFWNIINIYIYIYKHTFACDYF